MLSIICPQLGKLLHIERQIIEKISEIISKTQVKKALT